MHSAKYPQGHCFLSGRIGTSLLCCWYQGGLLEEVTLELGVEGPPSVSMKSLVKAVAFHDYEPIILPVTLVAFGCSQPALTLSQPPGDGLSSFQRTHARHSMVWAGDDRA